MNKDKVIELAKNAGLLDGVLHAWWEKLEPFAQAIREDYKAELLAGSGEPILYHSKSSANLINEKSSSGLVNKIICAPAKTNEFSEPLYAADQLAAAVLDAREECAKVCNLLPKLIDGTVLPQSCAAAIRERGMK